MIGFEVSGFWLSRVSNRASISSDATGAPFLGIPFIDQDGSIKLAVIAIPAGFPGNGVAGGETGSIDVHSTTRVWGAEANGVINLFRNDRLRIEGLVGFRYFNLQDTFDIRTTTNDAGATLAVAGVFSALDNSGTLQTLDAFKTRNQFYGGQIGIRGEYEFGSFRFGLSGKLALGGMNEQVDVRGNAFARDSTGVLLDTNRGYFAMANNIGSRSRSQFCVIPELEAKVSYAVTRWLSLSAGYDYFSVSRVARAAAQVDNRTDARLQFRDSTFDPNFQANLPGNDIRSNAFWAQGLTFGLELRW